jgi:hypothetical protein
MRYKICRTPDCGSGHQCYRKYITKDQYSEYTWNSDTNTYDEETIDENTIDKWFDDDGFLC